MPSIEGSSVGMKTGFFDFKQFFYLVAENISRFFSSVVYYVQQ
jgi:hypothetical protein